MVKIEYKKSRLRFSLIVGLILLSLGLISVLIMFVLGNPEFISWSMVGIGQILGGLMMLAIYFYERKKQYLSISEDGQLIKYTIFPRTINLSKVRAIKERFKGEYNLQTEANQLSIDTQMITPQALALLNNELKKWALL